MDEAGAPNRLHLVLGEPVQLRRSRRQVGYPRGVTGEVGGDQVRERTHRPQGPVDGRSLQHHRRPGLGVEDVPPRGGRGLGRPQHRVGVVQEHGHHVRVEGLPRPGPDHILHVAVVTDQSLVCGVPTHVDDAQWQRDLIATGASEDALAVPTLGQYREHLVNRLRHPETLGEHPRHFAQRDEMPDHEPGRPGEPGGYLPRSVGKVGVGGWQSSHHARETLDARAELPVGVVLGETAPEDLRPHVPVDGAAHIHEEGGVIGARQRLLVGVEGPAEPHRDQRGPEPVLEGDPHRQVGGQTQRGDHLGSPDLLGGLR